MLDEFDRKELRGYLNQCITLSQMKSKYHITDGIIKNGPKPIWRQGNTVLYDRDEFIGWLNSRKRYKTWTQREIRQVMILRRMGKKWDYIAYVMKRSPESCRSKWKDLRNGLSTSEQEDKAS